MPTFIAQNVQGIAAMLTIEAAIITGAFAFFGFFNKSNRTRYAEEQRLADNLIARLQQTVGQQTKDISDMRDDMEKHTKERDEQIKKLNDEVKHLQGRNSVLEDLFKGRDPAMQIFLKNAPDLIDIAHANNSLAKENSQALTHLTEKLAQFIDSLQPLLIHLDVKDTAETV